MSFHRLPVELILEVFMLHVCQGRYQLICRPFSDGSHWKSWYNFLSVCRRWHDLAIECPRLWTFIDLSSSLRCIKTMLHRSRGTPLHVQPTRRAPHRQFYDPESMVRIMQESHRIEHLKMFVKEEVVEALQLLQSFPIPLPIIRVLIVHNEITESSTLPFPFDPLPSTSFHALHVQDFTLDQVSKVFHRGIRELFLLLADEEHIGNQVEDGGDVNQGECIDWIPEVMILIMMQTGIKSSAYLRPRYIV